MRILRTARLTLEPQVAAHAAEMFAVLGDPAIYEHEGAPPASIAALRERFAKLESRRSPDGRQQWLNWVLRLESAEPVGYVQATVLPGGRALVAYELASRFWGQGLAHEAVGAMIGELAARYAVRDLVAVLKATNLRSLRLLRRLGFSTAPAALQAESSLEPGEVLMHRPAIL